MSDHHNAETLVYIGTYTDSAGQPPSEGIYLFRLDPDNGALSPVAAQPNAINPSFLATDPHGRYLYAVNETETWQQQPGGGVSAFSIDPADGTLTFINDQPSHGTAPCHLTVDQTGSWLLVANYGSGSVSVYPLGDEGRLGAATTVVQHTGSGSDPERQAGPHAHAVHLDPTNEYVLVNDLGVDRIFVYRFDARSGQLTPHDPPAFEAQPGAGPRQIAFHPSGAFMYCINELDSTLTTLSYDAEHGTLQSLQTLPTLPDTFSGPNTAADVRVTPSGRFVYASNRGHDSVALFAIDNARGTLRSIGSVPSGGRTPRNFAIDPTGTFALVANQDSHTVQTFRLDHTTGQWTPTHQVAHVPAPVCVLMLQRSIAQP